MEKRMNIYLDEISRRYLEKQAKETGKSMSSIIAEALTSHKDQNQVNLFQIHNDLFNQIGNHISSIEAERDYNNRVFSPAEEEIYQLLNKIWDNLREDVSCFRETPEERTGLICATDPEQWLKDNPYVFPEFLKE